MVEGDHDRARGSRGRLCDEVLEQVRVPEVQPVEHADDHEGGRSGGLDRVEAGDDAHALRRPRSPARARVPRRPPSLAVRLRAFDQHLVRVQRARDRAADGRDPAVGPDGQHDRRVAVRERALRGGDQALPEAPDLVVGDLRVGQVLEAGVDRAAGPWRRPPGRRRRPRAGRRAGPRPRAGTRPRRCARARRGRPRSRAAPRGRAPGRGCTCPRSSARPRRRSGRAGSVSSHSSRSRAWMVTSRAASTTVSPDRAS